MPEAATSTSYDAALKFGAPSLAPTGSPGGTPRWSEFDLNPGSALIRKRCRLRVDVQPYAPAGMPVRAYHERYHAGVADTVYTGPDHPSYIQLPIVPVG